MLNKMNKVAICLFVMGCVALSAFAHGNIIEKKKTDNLPESAPGYYVREDIKPNVNYLKTLPNWGGSWFSLPYKKNDTIAVNIVRSSYRYSYAKSPVLVLCTINDMKCVYENQTASLSFTVSGNKIAETNDGLFHFVLYAVGQNNNTAQSVVVGLYACARKNVTLSTCTSSCTKKCDHGSCSRYMNACVCYNGYTGARCNTKAKAPPTWDSEFYPAHHHCGVFFVVIFWVIVITILVWCIRACRNSRKMRAERANNSVPTTNATATAPPPPAPVGYAYYPLGTVPPPPPPPQGGIEMSSLPDSKAVYCTPSVAPVAPVTQVPVAPVTQVPVAPVTQVPVFVLPPPVPKN